MDDRMVGEALKSLDPERDLPGYWGRLQQRILATAGPELARRRDRLEITVFDMVFAWARTLVPLAAAAAVVAVALLVAEDRARGAPGLPVAMEEVLSDGVTEETFPMLFAGELVQDESAFLEAVEGRRPADRGPR